MKHLFANTLRPNKQHSSTWIGRAPSSNVSMYASGGGWCIVASGLKLTSGRLKSNDRCWRRSGRQLIGRFRPKADLRDGPLCCTAPSRKPLSASTVAYEPSENRSADQSDLARSRRLSKASIVARRSCQCALKPRATARTDSLSALRKVRRSRRELLCRLACIAAAITKAAYSSGVVSCAAIAG